MRKSEAELLKEQLEEYRGDEWSMTVVNLRNLGFHVPDTEHPFFIAALRANKEQQEGESEETPVEQVFQQQSEVVIWDSQQKTWSVHRATKFQIQRHAEHERTVYIFDTRERKFVPLDQFQLPPESR